MSELLPYLVTGVVAGSIYGLAALGLVLTYRTSGVFNFGFGAIAAAAAFVFYTLHFSHGLAWPVAALVTVVGFTVVVGAALELVTRPLINAPDTLVVVSTVGILLAVEGYLYLQFGDSTRTFPNFLPTSGFTISDVFVTWAKVISFAVAAALALAMGVALKRTRAGIAMRAVVDNPNLVALAGDRPERIRRLGWAIGSGVAAVSGILLAPVLNLDVNLLTFLVIQALGACAIGFFANLPATFAGGLVVGVTASIATHYITRPPLSGIPAATPFILLILALLIVPRARLPVSRMSLQGLIPPTRSMLSRNARLAVIVIGAAILVIVPFTAGARLPVWISGLSLFVVFVSLSLLVWGSGQLSLCHAAFVALGATSLSHLTAAGVPWLPALLFAGLLTVPAGLLVAIPAVRLSGIYLALATLGFGVLMQDVVYGSFLMFGKQQLATANRPHLWFITDSDRSLYFVTAAIAVICGATVLAVYRGRFGRFLRAMSDAPVMLRAQGLSVNITRLVVICLSAFFAGIGGGLIVTQTNTVSGITFGPTQSLLYVVIIGICGPQIIVSAVLAAVLLGVIPGYASIGVDQQTLIFGLVAITAGLLRTHREQLSAWTARLAAATEGYGRRRLPPLDTDAQPVQ